MTDEVRKLLECDGHCYYNANNHRYFMLIDLLGDCSESIEHAFFEAILISDNTVGYCDIGAKDFLSSENYEEVPRAEFCAKLHERIGEILIDTSKW